MLRANSRIYDDRINRRHQQHGVLLGSKTHCENRCPQIVNCCIGRIKVVLDFTYVSGILFVMIIMCSWNSVIKLNTTKYIVSLLIMYY